MKRGKQQKFLALYEPVHDRFERFCRARVYGEMEYGDLMNETLLVAYEKFDKLKSTESFLSFLFGISVRLLANSNRKKKPETGISQSVLMNAHVTDDTEQAAEVHLLHQALTHLPNTQREAILLFEIAGFSVRDIAKMQEASEDAVRQRLRRGRMRLTQILTFESKYKVGEKEI